ncbi:MAG: LytR/AlgR family response regulator transcription factor [Chitinophagaceae bacterium]
MRILIIEDEPQAAWNLQQTVRAASPDSIVLALLDSVQGVIDWFAANENPDLLISDIQLGDGLVFDAFQKIGLTCPVIFCTAYDEYWLRAFRENGIDYLLKPIDEQDLKRSFEKIEKLRRSLTPVSSTAQMELLLKNWVQPAPVYKNNFLIPYRDRLVPIKVSDIACFKVLDSSSELILLDGSSYQHSFTLEYLCSILDPLQFYRVNRQYLVAYSAIQEIEHYEDRKLLLWLKKPCAERILISKAKAPDFLKWIEGR